MHFPYDHLLQGTLRNTQVRPLICLSTQFHNTKAPPRSVSPAAAALTDDGEVDAVVARLAVAEVDTAPVLALVAVSRGRQAQRRPLRVRHEQRVPRRRSALRAVSERPAPATVKTGHTRPTKVTQGG